MSVLPFRVVINLVFLCCALIAFAFNAHAEPKRAHYAIPLNWKQLLNASSDAFKANVARTISDLIELREIPISTSNDIHGGLRAGSIDIAVLSASVLPISVGPFVVASDVSGNRRRQQSEVGSYQLALLERDGLVGLTFWNVPAPQVVTKGRVDTVADLRGLKIAGLTGASREILSGVGAFPVTMAAGEVFAALERGAVDGAGAIPGSAFTAAVQPADVSSAIVDSFGATEFVLVARKDYWLPLPYRAKVEIAKAARLAAQTSDQVAQAASSATAAAYRLRGIRLVKFSDRDVLTLRLASAEAWSRRTDGQNLDVLDRAYSVTRSSAAPDFGPTRQKAKVREIYFATERVFENEQEIQYQFGNRRRDDGPIYGLATVSLEADRHLGDDLEDVANIDSLVRFASESIFKSRIRAAPGFAGSQGILVFIHGYNNTFVDAVRRAAQFSVDIGFDGPVIAFSWPSDGTVLLYAHDEDRIPATRFGFTQFMRALETIRPRSKINLLAHSMGARVLLNYSGTLKEIGQHETQDKYRSLTLAASDTPVEFLRRQKDFLPKISDRITVYFSENDRALWLSEKLHQAGRLGNMSGDEIFLDQESASLDGSGMDFVDAADIDDAFLTFSTRHNYVFQKERGVLDVKRLLIDAMRAQARSADNPAAIESKQNGGKKFWALNP